MRNLLTMLFMMLPTMAVAADCPHGSDKILNLVSWEATMVDGGLLGPMPKVTVTYKYVGDKPVRMMNASVWFTDALGNSLSGFALDKDVTLATGEKHTESGSYPGASDFERLAKIKHTDAIGIACVDAVLYADGTKETFAKEGGN